MTDKTNIFERETQLDPKLDTDMKLNDDRSEAFWNENFGQLSELSVMFADTGSGGARIYGNSNNSARVLVNIKIKGRGDNAGKVISLSPGFLMDNVGLCEYSTGNDLAYGYNKQDMSGWFWRTKGRVDSHQDQDFIGTVDSAAVLTESQGQSGSSRVDTWDSETTQYPLYVSCSQKAARYNISAYVNIPGIGKFNCSMNGTSTPNGNPADSRPAQPFKKASLVSVEALAPVSYDDSTNLKVTSGWSSWHDWEFPVKDMSQFYPSGRDYSGTFSFNPFSLRVAPNTDNKNVGSRFVRKEIKGAAGGDASSMRWSVAPHILKGVTGGNYDLSALFIDQNYSGVLGGSAYYLKQQGAGADNGPFCYYYVGENDYRLYRGNEDKVSDEYIKIDIRNFCFTGGGNLRLVGSMSDDTAVVTVYDEFGNSGRVKIKFQESDWPRVRINEQLIG
ncbi:hypothetical protein [Cedecea sp.]|jgi:hypothetical protein|uniref:hypothetical protein n=1 Tax=Cedecea sp. TaxID=1970739 RepID=UPI002F40EF51